MESLDVLQVLCLERRKEEVGTSHGVPRTDREERSCCGLGAPLCAQCVQLVQRG